MVNTKKSKNRTKDNQMLEKGQGKFIVYYPGESYLYSTKSDDNVLKALTECLGSSDYSQLELSGKSISSLRKIRLGRDARDGPSRKAVADVDRFSVVNHQDEETQVSDS